MVRTFGLLTQSHDNESERRAVQHRSRLLQLSAPWPLGSAPRPFFCAPDKRSMTVLKLKADGSVEGAASGSDDAGHLDVRSRPSIVGGVGRGGDGYRGDPPHVAFNGEAADPAIQGQ